MPQAKSASKPGASQKPSLRQRLRRRAVQILIALLLLPPALTVLYSVVPPVSTLMLGRYVQFLWVDRQWVSLSDISPNLIKSVITSEDSGFCSNDGVEWGALQDQVEALSEGERPRGASTITMQTAKNLFLWGDRSYVRKALELPLALMLDAILSKKRILEIYLNIAEWGEGIFGAEAASHAWFGKPAKDLSRTEAARLATALPNPRGRNPAKPSAGHRRLAGTNLARVRQSGNIFGCVIE
ncbi:monofunctional biosynthetic peptidoglycan transglycosylase [Roseibium denhamense]|uniref:Biosynthetic peptidoglycan transglycosylase n=1 Tax=Roseibium denhamense TaxID=76305 RepID=A0ABY1PBN2_9HYPH|nr:monofunctional biosynthetic peptidoglycan transglycosylase [Roseibium denhamense]MTI07484.1 monofunctional biosynthetic peptidoglycan transglycosylase [Roseibium denhamense]SMP29993.1 monofunctional biosynthetic peptidoglycan transglycosylase [Roseibium denhamense]